MPLRLSKANWLGCKRKDGNTSSPRVRTYCTQDRDERGVIKRLEPCCEAARISTHTPPTCITTVVSQIPQTTTQTGGISSNSAQQAVDHTCYGRQPRGATQPYHCQKLIDHCVLSAPTIRTLGFRRQPRARRESRPSQRAQ